MRRDWLCMSPTIALEESATSLLAALGSSESFDKPVSLSNIVPMMDRVESGWWNGHAKDNGPPSGDLRVQEEGRDRIIQMPTVT
jgi:hypothetical protein